MMKRTSLSLYLLMLVSVRWGEKMLYRFSHMRMVEALIPESNSICLIVYCAILILLKVFITLTQKELEGLTKLSVIFSNHHHSIANWQ